MIRAEQLSKVFGSQQAVDAVSFEIGRGEVVGFLGRNGAGKSTTMRMLCGVLEPDHGRVWIDGLPVGGDDPRPRARIGYLPEGTPLHSAMRVLDYLAFAAAVKGLDRRAARAAQRDAIARCGLSGWETRRIDSLSKGYRQRVGLAQALLGDPPVLVLDEPSSGLDPAEVVRIRALVRELGRTRTVLLSTHVLREVDELCSRVLILAGGRLVADGSPSELCRRLGVRLRVRA
ncbi:MAG: ABC transporter ATP-binding protein, partial [Planctomycetes bacterium]|nr:ABC transporter ATP-binding protein [Planctomycetota bacterium]